MSLKLTTWGKNLLFRAMAGEVNINFTAIQLGNGVDAGEDARSMSNPILTMGISEYTFDDIFLKLTATYNNAELESDFYATETGVLAADPDVSGENLLYAYEYAPEEKADRIRSCEDKIVETQLDVDVYIGDADNVTATIHQSLVYVTESEFNAYIQRRDNPHQVTAAQVGLGNVPNVTPENQEPIFSHSYNGIAVSKNVDANGDTVETISFPNITTGEKMGIILQKIRTALRVVLDHLSTRNPHGITAKLIGAASSSHYHSANDINSGIMGIIRGGTGGRTAYDARVNLGIQAGSGSITGSAGKEAKMDIVFPKAYKNPPAVVLTPITDLDSTDAYLSVNSVSAEGFTVRIFSESLNHVINFYWIAVL